MSLLKDTRAKIQLILKPHLTAQIDFPHFHPVVIVVGMLLQPLSHSKHQLMGE